MKRQMKLGYEASCCGFVANNTTYSVVSCPIRQIPLQTIRSRSPKSTKSRNSESWVSRGTHSKGNFQNECVAVCCSVLQCVAMGCNVLQRAEYLAVRIQNGCVAVCCSVLQCVAACWVSRGTHSEWDLGSVWMCTGYFEVLDLVDFGAVVFVVETVIPPLSIKFWNTKTERKKQRVFIHLFCLLRVGAYRVYRISASSQDKRTNMYCGLN